MKVVAASPIQFYRLFELMWLSTLMMVPPASKRLSSRAAIRLGAIFITAFLVGF